MSIAPGTRLGPYEIVGSLGEGGMGEVYRARDTRLQRDVAVKTLPAGVANNPNRRMRFEREAQTISQVSHPNICAIYDVGDHEGVAYLVMEYIDGESLADRLRRGPIPWTTALPWAIDIASAIDAAHRRGIIHRDLKPANVMIGESGVKLLDFGIAKLLEESDATRLAPTASLTGERQLLGTVHYMAPEQLDGRDVDQRTDVFAFGAMFYELLTGRRAFDGANAAQVVAAILTSEPAPISSFAAMDPPIPRGLDHVIRRALAKDPHDRWQTARDLMIELQSIQARTSYVPSDAAQRPPAVGRRPWFRRPVVVALLVALALTGIWYLAHPPPLMLAVVPLEAAADKPGIDDLDDGITEAIINKLIAATPDRLRVIALPSVQRYKGEKNFNVQRAGAELGASMVLTLRITHQSEQLTIVPELVRAHDGSKVWGPKFVTSAQQVFAIEESIALTTLERLDIAISEEEKQRVRRRDTENFDALQQYLSGRFLVDKQGDTEENYQLSLEFFRTAIDLDRTFALAYAGKATAYTGMGFEGFMPPDEALENASDAYAKAKEYDPITNDGAVAQATLAGMRWHLDEAVTTLQNALRRSPNDPILYKSVARLLRSSGRWPEALYACERALKFDPLGVQSNAELGTTYAWKGELSRAIQQYRKTLDLDRRAGPVHELLADAYARDGKPDLAISELREALASSQDGAALAAALGAVYAQSGYDAAMKQFYQGQLEALNSMLAEGRYVSSMMFAQVYTSLGDVESAITSLREGYNQKEPWLALIKNDPAFARLKSDSRFQQIVRDVGVPDVSLFRSHLRVLRQRIGF